MQKISFLLIGTSLSLIPTITFAQCVATQDCETLGYTETSCNGGKGVKCPFGNKWACLTSEEECLNLACDKLGFTYTCTGTGEKGVGNDCNGKYQSCTCDSSYKYTCSGTGYSGGSGAACGGKYTKCNCSNNYTWNGSNCVLSCSSSYKYTCSGTGYSGGSGSACGGKYTACTCASGYEWNGSSCLEQLNGAQGELFYCNGKVVGVKASGMSFYVATEDWGPLTWDEASFELNRYYFCSKFRGTFPNSYQLKIIYNNKSAINTLLSRNGGRKLKEDYYWSSTGNDPHTAVNMSDGSSRMFNSYYNDKFVARSILGSW